MSLPAPHEVAERVIDAANGRPCVVIVEEADQTEVRFANNTTTTNGRRLDRRVVVICLQDREDGVAAGVASHSGDVDVHQILEAASADATSAPASPDAAALVEGAADPSFGDPAVRGDLTLFNPIVEGLGVAFEAAGSTRVLSGFAEHQSETIYLASSTGLRRRHVQHTGEVQMVARSSDGSRSSWVAQATADLSCIDVAEMDHTLTQRLKWAERHVELPAGRYEVVLPPAAVSDLMADLSYAASGADAEEGHSVFSAREGKTRVGQQLSQLPFQLYGDPTAPGLECCPFVVVGASSSDASVFDNGAPVQRTFWLRDGRLGTLRYHRAGAARSKAPFAPPVDNLVLELEGATGSTEDLVARTERGLLLTCLWYIREVDPATLLLTGLTRDGVYLIDHGEIVGAVNNFRFNESPVDLLARSTEVGQSVRSVGREFGEWLNRVQMPPLRVADFNMSSTSAAS